MRKMGWSVSDAKGSHDSAEDDFVFLEIKLAFARSLRERRTMRRMTQAEFARMIKSSQSRVAKMESADPTVSLDLLVRGLLALGASNMDLARVMTYSRLLARKSRS